jgi:hypothetical protein
VARADVARRARTLGLLTDLVSAQTGSRCATRGLDPSGALGPRHRRHALGTRARLSLGRMSRKTGQVHISA